MSDTKRRGKVSMTFIIIHYGHERRARCFIEQDELRLQPLSCRVRDRPETNWTVWGPSVLHIWSRPIERYHRRSCSTSRMSRLRSDQRWSAIGHSKVQVISCRSLNGVLIARQETRASPDNPAAPIDRGRTLRLRSRSKAPGLWHSVRKTH